MIVNSSLATCRGCNILTGATINPPLIWALF